MDKLQTLTNEYTAKLRKRRKRAKNHPMIFSLWNRLCCKRLQAKSWCKKFWAVRWCKLGFHDWHFGIPLGKTQPTRWCRRCYAEKIISFEEFKRRCRGFARASD